MSENLLAYRFFAKIMFKFILRFNEHLMRYTQAGRYHLEGQSSIFSTPPLSHVLIKTAPRTRSFGIKFAFKTEPFSWLTYAVEGHKCTWKQRFIVTELAFRSPFTFSHDKQHSAAEWSRVFRVSAEEDLLTWVFPFCKPYLTSNRGGME